MGMRATVCLAILLLSSAGCEIKRDRPAGDGYHEAGWANTNDGGSHVTWLRNAGYPIEDCQVCHGTDGAESPINSSCSSAGCHERGVAFCGTCHGDSTGPKPQSGAHDKHVSFCIECHAVPNLLRDPGHLDGTIDVTFSGLATGTIWNTATQSCSNGYCHANTTAEWKAPSAAATPCDACHGNPPDSHIRFAQVATPSSCATCHPDAMSPEHINGYVETNPPGCSNCHGKGPLGAPPEGLDGSTSSSSKTVGAHRRHLDETLPDRIGKVAACNDCHIVPLSFDAPGHLDTAAPSDVLLVGGNYDPSNGQCASSCHFDVSPGPVWNDDSGAARACDACHGFPPAYTRKGTQHTPCAPTLTTCLPCHSYAPETHVDGSVDLAP